ncbi:MAG TPA: hypothetical protein VHZ78_06795 [Rhizomicrobium sp.]|jgi:hypothetical protein|nr:hypothetical protein [Rhizomicrobium sp.]
MFYAMIAILAVIVAVSFYAGGPFAHRWSPATFRGRLRYLAFCFVGIIILVTVMRFVRGHWG